MGNRAILLYDGECAFCKTSVAIVQRLDWRNRVECRDARDPSHIPECAEPLESQKLMEEMHLVAPDRRRAFAGYRAIRWLAWRLPLLWPLAPFLYLPGALWLGSRGYRWIARHRFQLVPCTRGACQVPRTK